MDERFIPAKKQRVVEQIQPIRGLHPEIAYALNSFRPDPNRRPQSCASAASSVSSDSSWETIGGRVQGTNNILLNYGGKSKAGGTSDAVLAELDEFPLDGDAIPKGGRSIYLDGQNNTLPFVFDTNGNQIPPVGWVRVRPEPSRWDEHEDDNPSSAQNVIRRNIDAFLKMQMNRYVLNNREFLDLSDRDVEQVQKNIINYWLDRHQKIEKDPLYNFCELVAGALDEKVEFLLADARDFRQVYEGKQGTGKEFRSTKTVQTLDKKTSNGETQQFGRKDSTPGVVQGESQDSFISEQQSLLKKEQVVREALKKYAEAKIEGRNASLGADVFMAMLKDFEISGHIEVKPVLTNSWKAVHRVIMKTAFPPRVTHPLFFELIPNPSIRAAYARATALQIMIYRQLDKRRSYLAVDYDRIKEQLAEAIRDIVDVLRNELVLGEPDPAWDAITRGIASSSGRALDMITDISGKLLPPIRYEVENTFAQIRIKRGISPRLTLDGIVRTPILSNLFGKLVGMQLRLQLDPKHQGRLTIEMQQREGEVNSMWTEVLSAMKQAGFLKLPVARYGACASFS